jgi:hypothetical protein
MARLVLREMLDLQDHKACKVYKAFRVTLELPEQQALKVRRALPDLPVETDQLDQLGRLLLCLSTLVALQELTPYKLEIQIAW